jgi:hypothetical protein
MMMSMRMTTVQVKRGFQIFEGFFRDILKKKSKNRKALPIKCKEIETGW